MRRALRKDHAAQADLLGIWQYTHEKWGVAQADAYIDALEAGIRPLLDDPERGIQRDDLRRDYWSRRIRHHVVFYTFTEDELRIRRVLHEVRDFGRHLDDDGV